VPVSVGEASCPLSVVREKQVSIDVLRWTANLESSRSLDLESIARWCKRHRLEAYATLRRGFVTVVIARRAGEQCSIGFQPVSGRAARYPRKYVLHGTGTLSKAHSTRCRLLRAPASSRGPMKVCGVERRTPTADVERRTSNVERRTLNVER
jgi:hypothetical protein